jgi:hypothetical protein|nr:MAG TPA: major tail protein [Caudoviricetes sp.]
MITGLRPESFQKLQLNAGVFLAGFDFASAKDAAAVKTAIKTFIQTGEGVLGATRGGGSFECTPDIRAIEADGKRYEFKGSEVNDGWTVKLKTTLIEATPENFARALMCATVTDDTGGKMHTIRVRTDIANGDYIPKLCWVGDTSEGFVLIELSNALNITGANFTFTDKGEGTLPVEFTAHQDSLDDMEYAPCQIVFFDKAA